MKSRDLSSTVRATSRFTTVTTTQNSRLKVKTYRFLCHKGHTLDTYTGPIKFTIQTRVKLLGTTKLVQQGTVGLNLEITTMNKGKIQTPYGKTGLLSNRNERTNENLQ